MGKFFVIASLFALAGLCEIGGGYLVWGWLRDNKPVLWGLAGGLVLALYGVVAALQPIPEFGRVYAAYGGVFIALAVSWSMLVDGFVPDRWDILGASLALSGVAVMILGPRG
jgi:small multidrug resistance family-3 protein